MSKAAPGKLISEVDDFPTAKVYERLEPGGPVYTVQIRNKEERPDWLFIARLSPIFIVGALFWWTFFTGDESSAFWLIAFLIIAPLSIIYSVWPYKTNRAIELNFSDNAFRVRRNDRLSLERKLDRMHSLTTEDHPQASSERQRKNGAPGVKQKQHCLFGWFGQSGAERVCLFCRLEWPSQNSLHEVQQAVRWAIDRARNFYGEDDEIETSEKSIKPPLD